MKRFSILFPFALVLVAILAFAQSDFIAPNENLVAEGIPQIPASIAEIAGRYSDYRADDFESWHPTKREMLIETRFADTYQVHQVKFPGGARTQLTFFPDRVAGAQYQPVNGESFLFSKDVGGGEFFQIYRYDFASGKITLLTDGKSRNVSPHWSYQGDRIAYASTKRTGNDLDIWVLNAADPSSARMVAQMEGGGWECRIGLLMANNCLPSMVSRRLRAISGWSMLTRERRSCLRRSPDRIPRHIAARASREMEKEFTLPVIGTRNSSSLRTWTWRRAKRAC
jgi:hypothetical protein